MAEQFDPNISLRPAADGLPDMVTDMDPPSGLSSALTQTRQAFSGLEDLPIDEPLLEGQEVLPAEEPPPPARAIALPIEPAVVADGPSVPDSATAARLALLEAELAVLRATPTHTPESVPTVPLTVSEEVYSRITDRFQQNFAAMAEQRAEESDQQFEQRRARGFAEAIVAAVYEDLLPTDAVQARFQPTAERVAQHIAQQTIRQDRETTTLQAQQDTLIAQAVNAARTAGYDVHLPGTPAHGASAESRLFWGAATQIDPQLPGEQQIRDTLRLMPTKTPAVSTPAPAPRPQPMGRQGAGPTPAPAGQGQEYQPMSMGGMLNQHQQVRRIGTA